MTPITLALFTRSCCDAKLFIVKVGSVAKRTENHGRLVKNNEKNNGVVGLAWSWMTIANISRSYQDDGMFLKSMTRSETLEVDESIILITKAGHKIERVYVPGVLLL